MLAFLSTALLFLLVIFVLVLVHEWGHFAAAKRLRMRVDEFGIGFPPRVWGVRRGETEYTLNALPIGGFVRIFGEDPTEVENASSAERDRAFNARPYWAQAVVLVAGVVMNVLFAWLLFIGVFAIGVPTAIDAEDASDRARLVATQILPESPLAGSVPPGATITELAAGDETRTDLTPDTFSSFITEHAAADITLTYTVGDRTETITVTPTTGLIPNEPDVPAVGVSLSLVETVRHGPLAAIGQGTARTGELLIAISVGLGGLLAGAVTGTADLSQVAGPVGIAGLVGDAAAFGVVPLLTFVAVISLNLAIINLLPLPALDGGRLVFVAIEAVRGQAIDPVWAQRVNLAGFALLMLLMLIITYRDIARLI
jgi:regulator of sigma E protease